MHIILVPHIGLVRDIRVTFWVASQILGWHIPSQDTPKHVLLAEDTEAHGWMPLGSTV